MRQRQTSFGKSEEGKVERQAKVKKILDFLEKCCLTGHKRKVVLKREVPERKKMNIIWFRHTQHVVISGTE